MVGRKAKAAAEGRILLCMGKLFLLRALVEIELGAGLTPEAFLEATLPLLSDLHLVDRVEVTFHCENELKNEMERVRTRREERMGSRSTRAHHDNIALHSIALTDLSLHLSNKVCWSIELIRQ